MAFFIRLGVALLIRLLLALFTRLKNGPFHPTLTEPWNAKYIKQIFGATEYINNKKRYNNFPWQSPSESQKQRIEQTAQGILNARAIYPDSSLADLYDPLTMPPELRKAHQLNDKAVMQAYGMPIKDTDEAACVAWLMTLYQAATST